MNSARPLKSAASLSFVLLTSLSMAAGAELSVSAAPAPALSAERQAFFGELHLHTGYSFDAYSFMGARTTPDEALRFARGEPITYLGQSVQRPRALDFAAVTDHAEYLGVINQMGDGQSALSRSDLGRRLREQPFETFMQIARGIDTHQDAPELNAKPAMAGAWLDEIKAADDNYRPGSFTTFNAYEWTAMKDKKNLHRNVIFKGPPAESPFSASDSQRPEDLWKYLDQLRARGIEALAISHNANASGGLMFDWGDSDGRPIDESYAEQRALDEPLTEIFQTKGQSETVPELSSADEFNDFEIMEHLLTGEPSPVNGSYARQALGRGLIIESRVGTNPYKLGFVGGSDSHSGLTNGDENAFAGQSGIIIDPNRSLPSREAAERILAPPPPPAPGGRFAGLGRLSGSPGLTGVWAEHNDRDSIYAALRRKETFATSGPEIRLRFFSGWNIAPDALTHSDWVATAYRTDVAMGADLPARPVAGRSPAFIVQAAKDPMSGNLDRLQIVKVWLQGGAYQERVFDVAWSPERKRDSRTGRVPAVRNTVNLKTATYTNDAGAAQLSGVWHDPAFDPKIPAVYYARAIEIPTPRWSTILAVRRELPLAPDLPATLQERAVSSPIWYTPPVDTAEHRRSPTIAGSHGPVLQP
jgi:hypothetical protein